jgi:hypothetical protein
MKNRYAAIAIGLCITGTAMAQLAPIAAKVHDGVESIVGGKVVVEHVHDGVLYRAPDGSTVTRYQDEKGQMEGLAHLWDTKTGGSYRLDLATRIAHTGALSAAPSQALTPEAMAALDGSLKNLPDDNVEGISCKVRPMHDAQ